MIFYMKIGLALIMGLAFIGQGNNSSGFLSPVVYAESKPSSQAKPKGKFSDESDSEPVSTAKVKLMSFYLKTGKLVSGKVISEEKNKITIAQTEESRIVLSTFGIRDVNRQTLSVRLVPEYVYYDEMGMYFAGRTGDFKDDPDDFIQAIRFYENAQHSLMDSPQKNSEKIKTVEKKIGALKADRQVWAREVKSRAELKKLEFESMFNERMKELEDKRSKDQEKIEIMLLEVKNLREEFSKLDTDINWDFQRLEGEIITNKEDINQLWRRQTPAYYMEDPFYNYQRQGYQRNRPRTRYQYQQKLESERESREENEE